MNFFLFFLDVIGNLKLCYQMHLNSYHECFSFFSKVRISPILDELFKKFFTIVNSCSTYYSNLYITFTDENKGNPMSNGDALLVKLLDHEAALKQITKKPNMRLLVEISDLVTYRIQLITFLQKYSDLFHQNSINAKKMAELKYLNINDLLKLDIFFLNHY